MSKIIFSYLKTVEIKKVVFFDMLINLTLGIFMFFKAAIVIRLFFVTEMFISINFMKIFGLGLFLFGLWQLYLLKTKLSKKAINFAAYMSLIPATLFSIFFFVCNGAMTSLALVSVAIAAIYMYFLAFYYFYHKKFL